MHLIYIRTYKDETSTLCVEGAKLHMSLQLLQASWLIKTFTVSDAIDTIKDELGLTKWVKANFELPKAQKL